MPSGVDIRSAVHPRCFLATVVLGLVLSAAPVAAAAGPGTVPAPVPAAGAAEPLNAVDIGYDWVTTSGGGETLRPYDGLDSHFRGELDLFYLVPPQSYFDFIGRYQGENSSQIKASVDYRGLLNVQLISDRYPHNQEQVLLPPPDPASRFNPEDLNPDDHYRRDIGDHAASIKFRLPMYPAHLRLAVRRFEVSGNKQQIFNDQNCLSLCHTISKTRDIDSRTDQVEVGTDVHIGYADISYSFKTTRYDNRAADPVHAFGPLFEQRPPLELAHNVYPDSSSFRHSLYVTSSGLGKVALAYGFGIGQRENKDLRIKEDYQRSGGDLVWRPYRRLNLSLKVRHYAQDNDPGPELKTLRQAHEQPIAPSQTTDEIQALVNYYLLPELKLQGKFSHRQRDWQGTEAWNIPGKSTSDTWRLVADYRLRHKINVKLSYQNTRTEDPPYANSPTDDWEAAAAADWHILPALLFQAQYKETRKDNDESGREQERRQLRGSLSATLGPSVTVGLHQLFFEDDVTRDLTFSLDTPLLSPAVPYEATGTQSLLRISWVPIPDLALEGGCSYLRAKGSFRNTTAPFEEIGAYSAFDGEQWGASLNVNYTLAAGWELSARYEHLRFDDRGAADRDEEADTVLAFVRRRW